MAPALRSLLVDGAAPETVPVVSLLRALRLDEAAHAAAAANAAVPVHNAVASVRGALPPGARAALRALADAEATTGRDTVDGGPDHQVNVAPERLATLVGAAPLAALRAAVSRGERGQIVAFVRKYESRGRPGIPFHNDAADRTCNVALGPNRDASLLVVCGGAVRSVDRAPGDATLHSSALLHGVAATPPGAPRYTLILFFRRD